MKRLLLILAILSLALGAKAGTVAIVGGTIIDGNGGKPIQDGVILITDKRIAAIGNRTLAIPVQAKKIDARGKYVIPGLMDANVHLVLDDKMTETLIRHEGRYDELAVEAAQIALKGGVTSVFDTWGPREPLIKARDKINSGAQKGARIYLAGNIIGLGGPYSRDFFPKARAALSQDFAEKVDRIWQENVGPELMTMSAGHVRDEIRSYVRSGIDFVKYAVTGHSTGENWDAGRSIVFSPRVQRIIVEEAHRAGLPVTTHTPTIEGLEMAVGAGVDLMQHCGTTIDQLIPPETLALIARSRIPCALTGPTTDELERMRRGASGASYLRMAEMTDENDRALIAAGAVILLSTDSGVVVPSANSAWAGPESLFVLGDGHFNWMIAAEQKGMEPMEILLAATRNIARAYRVDKDFGTLARGKIADLLILDRNPLESARNYRSVSMVMKDGGIIDRDALPELKILTPPAVAH